MTDTSNDLQPVWVDKQVFATLQMNATPLVDDANAVLRRLLGLTEEESNQALTVLPASGSSQKRPVNADDPAKPARRKRPAVKKQRAPKGSLLPEIEYERPLLEALCALGGAGASAEIIDLLEAKLDDKLTPLDREPLASGHVRWRNRVQFVRLSLVKKGLMEKDSPRGTWAVTDAGREFVGSET